MPSIATWQGDALCTSVEPVPRNSHSVVTRMALIRVSVFSPRYAMLIADRLHYNKDGNWLPLPSWGRFFIQIGTCMAENTVDGNRRSVLALVLPARAFAAPLLSVGVVLSRSHIPVPQPGIDEYFDLLCSMPRNTRVTYMRSGRKHDGILYGKSRISDVDYVSVMISIKGSLHICHVPRDKCREITVSAVDGGQPPKKLSRGRRVLPSGGLLGQVFDAASVLEFVRRSRLECIILGRIGELRHEIVNTPFAIQVASGAFGEGNLQDLIRVRRFAGSDQCHRSNVVDVSRSGSPFQNDRELPSIVVFDGSRSFLRWRDYWRQSNWILCLDRTESDFGEAVEELNREYTQRRSRLNWSVRTPLAPSRVEVLMYQESAEWKK